MMGHLRRLLLASARCGARRLLRTPRNRNCLNSHQNHRSGLMPVGSQPDSSGTAAAASPLSGGSGVDPTSPGGPGSSCPSRAASSPPVSPQTPASLPPPPLFVSGVGSTSGSCRAAGVSELCCDRDSLASSAAETAATYSERSSAEVKSRMPVKSSSPSSRASLFPAVSACESGERRTAPHADASQARPPTAQRCFRSPPRSVIEPRFQSCAFVAPRSRRQRECDPSRIRRYRPPP